MALQATNYMLQLRATAYLFNAFFVAVACGFSVQYTFVTLFWPLYRKIFPEKFLLKNLLSDNNFTLFNFSKIISQKHRRPIGRLV